VFLNGFCKKLKFIGWETLIGVGATKKTELIMRGRSGLWVCAPTSIPPPTLVTVKRRLHFCNSTHFTMVRREDF
uniref:Uncharacterized protein n=1 Tax=Oncorhynchus kisutch TaxID=8019 RepID=A0A8C7KH02_ONCKI